MVGRFFTSASFPHVALGNMKLSIAVLGALASVAAALPKEKRAEPVQSVGFVTIPRKKLELVLMENRTNCAECF